MDSSIQLPLPILDPFVQFLWTVLLSEDLLPGPSDCPWLAQYFLLEE